MLGFRVADFSVVRVYGGLRFFFFFFAQAGVLFLGDNLGRENQNYKQVFSLILLQLFVAIALVFRQGSSLNS